MIELKLFLTFFKIGAVSFGGGFGMISLIREQMLINGWMTEEQLTNLIAVAESTPGPIAVNLATFVGSVKGGFSGAVCATIGVILPSFLIILLIAAVIQNLLKNNIVRSFIRGIHPCIVALILSTAAAMALKRFFHFTKVGDPLKPDLRSLLLFCLLYLIAFLYRKIQKKKLSSIRMILISAVLGLIFFFPYSI